MKCSWYSHRTASPGLSWWAVERGGSTNQDARSKSRTHDTEWGGRSASVLDFPETPGVLHWQLISPYLSTDMGLESGGWSLGPFISQRHSKRDHPTMARCAHQGKPDGPRQERKQHTEIKHHRISGEPGPRMDHNSQRQEQLSHYSDISFWVLESPGNNK